VRFEPVLLLLVLFQFSPAVIQRIWSIIRDPPVLVKIVYNSTAWKTWN